MGDYYTENPEELKDQPKKTIADYVEENRILVPRRFKSLRKAKKSGLHIIIRSEHPQDYDGASGLLWSPDLNEDLKSKNEKKIKKEVVETAQPRISEYCSLLNISEKKFINEISFSYWEIIEGYNRAVIADSAIKGKYHIICEGVSPANYTIFDNGKINSFCNKLPSELEEDLPKIIELYEEIRNLDKFDSNHCPIMEFQSSIDNGKVRNFFLQYHRTRDFEPSDFVIERGPEKNEVKSRVVRGKTPPEGINVKAILVYGFESLDCYNNWKLSEQEDARMTYTHNRPFSEIMSRRRKVNLIDYKSLKHILTHFLKSTLFKPELSIINSKELYTQEEYSLMLKNARETKTNQTIDFHVISDGRKAYIKRI